MKCEILTLISYEIDGPLYAYISRRASKQQQHKKQNEKKRKSKMRMDDDERYVYMFCLLLRLFYNDDDDRQRQRRFFFSLSSTIYQIYQKRVSWRFLRFLNNIYTMKGTFLIAFVFMTFSTHVVDSFGLEMLKKTRTTNYKQCEVGKTLGFLFFRRSTISRKKILIYDQFYAGFRGRL